eukprot:366367-Chlamydomonas_euryale.AAC.17
MDQTGSARSYPTSTTVWTAVDSCGHPWTAVDSRGHAWTAPPFPECMGSKSDIVRKGMPGIPVPHEHATCTITVDVLALDQGVDTGFARERRAPCMDRYAVHPCTAYHTCDKQRK